MQNNILKVGNTYLEVQSYEFDKMELDLDSGRNLNGIMDRNILSHHPRKIIVKFPPMLNGSEMSALLTLLDHSVLTVGAFNPFTNAWEDNIKMMHGDLKPVVYWKVENIAGTEIEVKYQQLQVELVEY